MLLIVGLGNPGSEHAKNRHSVGFMAADAIHRRHGFSSWRRRFQAEVCEAQLGPDKCLIIKPQTYMNESGRAVQAAAHFYKLAPKDIVVIHDEVDLAPGKFRMKAGGGTAGHNGLRSIGAAIGDGFRRLRIGVGRPRVKEAVPGYVLRNFAKEDGTWLNPLLDAIADHAPLLAAGRDSTFANRLHEALGDEPKKKRGSEAKDKTAGTTAESAPPAEPHSPPAGENDQGPLAGALKKLFGR